MWFPDQMLGRQTFPFPSNGNAKTKFSLQNNEKRRCSNVSIPFKRQRGAKVFTAPSQGWRWVSVRERRTAIDWAEEVKHLLEAVYPDAERMTLVCDNLNTHKIASLSKAFPAEVARRLDLTIRDRLHAGSWQLVEHRRDRVECVFKTMSEPAAPRYRDTPLRSRSLADPSQSDCQHGGLALHHGGRTHQTKKTIPSGSKLKEH